VRQLGLPLGDEHVDSGAATAWPCFDDIAFAPEFKNSAGGSIDLVLVDQVKNGNSSTAGGLE
jgi:hypothetical protein